MDPPHTDPEAATAHGEAHAEHLTSWAPIVIAASVGFLYLSFAAVSRWGLGTFAVISGLGVGIMAIGLGRWIYEDIQRFRRLPAAAEHHGQPGPFWGIALFIATEVMIFGSLFAVWFVGENNLSTRWAFVDLPVTATAINTGILVASGGTLHWGYLGLRKNQYNRYLTGLTLTIILGAIFLGQQVREYLELIHEQDFTISSDLYGSIFYMLTGTHGAHVAGGLLFLVIVLFRSLKRTQSREHHIALEAAAMYWHFVDVVWLFLFVVVYLQWL